MYDKAWHVTAEQTRFIPEKKKEGISKRPEQALIMTKVDVKSVLFLYKRLSRCLTSFVVLRVEVCVICWAENSVRTNFCPV